VGRAQGASPALAAAGFDAAVLPPPALPARGVAAPIAAPAAPLAADAIP